MGVPRMGLLLDSARGLRLTAISHVAHQTEIGNKTGAPLEHSTRLGVRMPIIDPGRPGNSYLMYKLLRRPTNFETESGEDCTSQYTLGLGGQCLPPSAEENERLREWFVRLSPMPLEPFRLAPEGQSSRRQLELIQRWIAEGASSDGCP